MAGDHTKVGLSDSTTEFNACLNANGLYHSVQCVLRLSPEIHRKLANLPHGILVSDIDPESVKALSTYLHETIHWWQHVGSTAGLMRSLSYPVQAHANYLHLKRLLELVGPVKSILRWLEVTRRAGGPPDSPVGLANTVVNNHFDVEFYRAIATSPQSAQNIVSNKFFESLGHSYSVAYLNILLTLSATLDDNFRIITDPRQWEKEFAVLRAQRKKGYYRGSEVVLSPIGMHQIFEGQARFAQLQFLYFGSGGRVSWDEIRRMGMLSGVYVEAFEAFLRLAELEWPQSIDHPTVALFLLVCDLAINPGAGFPLTLRAFQVFIEDVDPGMRFLLLCRSVATKCQELKMTITEYSRDQYAAATEALAISLLVDSPLAIVETVNRWALDSEAVKTLMTEHCQFAYETANLPVRLLLAHFVAFSQDKLARPEFFCWPGAWMAGERASPEIGLLVDRHEAPFIDKPEDAGVYPRLRAEKDEAIAHKSFSTFYSTNVTYDLTRQWISKAGPFEYDYGWLSSGTSADFKAFGGRHFKIVYGVHPDRFDLL